MVADDELHLGSFEARGERPGELVRLLPGILPHKPKARKAAKPDFEVLVRLAAGGLLALGSGSTPDRCTGVTVPLDAGGSVAGAARIVDFTGLRSIVAARFASPNIEGGCLLGDELILLQRGNKRDPVNALLGIPLDAITAALASGRFDEASGALRAVEVDLRGMGDAPLSFTDCASLPDGRIVFTAVAEDTRDSYNDGPCSAAAVGLMDRAGRVSRLSPLAPTRKIEGVHAWLEGSAIRLLLVTDADDALVPAELLAAELA